MLNMDTEQNLNQQTETVAKKEAEIFSVDSELLKEMAEKGVMYGHRKQKTHPKFKPFIFTTRNDLEIIDLEKTLQGINNVAEFLNKQIEEKRVILLIGTQAAAWEAVNNFAKKFNFPFIKNKWIGGLITNFKIVYQRIEHFRKMKSGMEQGAYDKYTKKERVMMNKDISRMQVMFYGLENFTKVPDALFIIDSSLKNHMTAIKEAHIAGIPIIGIIDSDDNPTGIAYPIPANDHSKSSINWILEKIAQQIKITNNQQSITDNQ
ncbi:MAG: 30S ribosomal protein S2 [Patescibacteria group bacterium]|nr:30S ribosomal protein S2 [Patescibacteria group bacterium]